MFFAEKGNVLLHKWWGKKRGPLKPAQQGKQYARLADMNKQRLMGYAESFREIAESFQEEFSVEYMEETGKRHHILEERMLWENRQLISSNLCEVAEIMKQVATREICYEPMEETRQKMLVHALRAEGIYAEDFCYLPYENGSRAMGMQLSTEKRKGISSDEVADMLSVLLRERREASVTSPYMVDEQKRTFLFVEEPHFITFTGLSKATKETESISGDNFSILQSETGKVTVLISDGTGSGEQANADSGKVLDLMEKMLEAGFGIRAAANMVNKALFSKGEESNHPTLDICDVDLYGGSCDIWKIGGAVTLLKRGDAVDKINPGTLPLGIFQSLEVSEKHCQLKDGDYLIFMTDGVLDALGEKDIEALDPEELMTELVRTMPERNPQDIAESLLQRVLRYSNGHIHDDMTILVLGIWENS